MSGCCKSLCKHLCPHHIDEIKGDGQDGQAKDKYDDYQTFLSTMMTIGTLLLGFILTGTLLNYNYQGNHPRTGFAYPFDMVSLAAAAFATMSVMLSLWVSVRASVIFRNNGPKRALRAMRNSTLGTGVAELSLYVSVNFFFISVLMYIWWAQQGPSEVCGSRDTAIYRAAAGQRDGRPVRLEAKRCPMMEADLRGVLERLCRDDDGDIRTQSTVCDWYSHHQMQKERFFHHLTRKKNPAVVLELASDFCRSEQLEQIARDLCDDAGKLSDDHAMKCALANTDALAAAECTDDTVDLAVTCSNVCDSTFDLFKQLTLFGVPGTLALIVVFILRAIKIGQQVFANWQYNIATTTRRRCCCHELGIIDTFSSEEEQIPSKEQIPGKRDLGLGASERLVPSGALAA